MADATPGDLTARVAARPLRGWFSDLSVLNKSRLVLLSMLVLFLAACGAFLYIEEYTRIARLWTVHTYEVLALAERSEAQLLHSRRTLREGLLAADPSQVQVFEAERRELDASLAQLRRLTGDNPAQRARLDRFEERLRDWSERFVRPSVDLLRQPQAQRAAAGAADYVRAATLAKPEFDAMLRQLDEFRESERQLLAQRTQRLAQAHEYGRYLVAGVMLVGLLAALYALTGVRRVLAEPLNELTDLIPAISSGDHAADVPYRERRDEVGEFARALFGLREVIADRRAQDWVRTHLAELAGSLQHADTHQAFGDTLLRGLCAALQAGYGVAYRWNEDSGYLEACAAYGLPESALAQARFRMGQGLVGQCLVEARLLALSPVPAEHFRITSGLGSAAPHTLSFAPLISRGEAVGVLELATLAPVDKVPAQLLRDVLGPSALAWQTLSRSLRTRELLDTTRAQAEELQASEEALRVQQEQLRTVNEALRARSLLLEQQGKRLQASEEELRAQAEELRVANDALRERGAALRQRQDELEAARNELQRRADDLEMASRYKSEFLANMSHELRTPLNSLLILSKGLADNEEGNLSEEQIESARIVHDSGKNLLQLINDILDLSKVEAGKMQLVLEDVNLAAFAAMQERNFRHVAQSRGLSFDVVLEPGAPRTVRTDGTRLGQIVVNLLSNGFKFTQRGGVTLRIGRPDPQAVLRMQGLSAQQAVSLSVTDTGIGIPADKLDQVFQAFEQADSSTSRRFGGTGLGLSIVRGMTRLLGGEVQVSSVEGQGSTFSVIVPELLSEPEAEPKQQAASAAAAPADALLQDDDEESARDALDLEELPGEEPQRASADAREPALLIVEDDAHFASVLTGIAARKKLRTLVTSSGKTALRIAREEPLMGVLLDIGLPDISGWKVLEELKAQPRTRDLPVHVISSNDDRARGMALGAVGYLTKPVTKESVVAALERVALPPDAGKRAPRRLLLVDDDPASRKAVRKLLESEAQELVEVGDAASAIEALRQQTFHCVILDLGLPDVSGFELLDRLAAEGPLPPVVVYSGRELTAEENLRLREYTESIVIKGARSPERLLDEVSLFLHALQPADGGLAPAWTEPAKDVAGRHVLIVDDDMRNIFALSKALRSRKLRVTMAQDGYKALTQLEANPDIDLVLMDIMMPGLDGYETIRRIREQPRWEQLPIIAVTAKAMTGDREKCLEAGASDYCSKPIDVDKLMSQIRVWV